MKLTEIRINLCPGPHGKPHASAAAAPGGQRLRAFCSLTFDNTFVIHDVKLIDGNGGLFLAMPSRKLSDHCPGCGEKNHLRDRFCNECGRRLDEDRAIRQAHDCAVRQAHDGAGQQAHDGAGQQAQFAGRQLHDHAVAAGPGGQRPSYTPTSCTPSTPRPAGRSKTRSSRPTATRWTGARSPATSRPRNPASTVPMGMEKI